MESTRKTSTAKAKAQAVFRTDKDTSLVYFNKVDD